MDAQKLGTFIATTRKEKGMTQRELAERLNVTDKAISKWERGLGLPDIQTIEPLADVLGVTIMDIMRAEPTQQDVLPKEQVSQMLSDTIDLATHHRKTERRNAFIACLSVVALVCAVFLIDDVGIIAFVFIYLPIISFGVGIVLLISSFRKWRRRIPFALTLIVSMLCLLYPFVSFAFFVYGWFMGGGVPN